MLKKYLKSAIYLSLLIYIYISVFSYNYKDPSLNTATNEEVTNLGGIVSSYLADILVQFLGLTSVTIATTIVYLLIFRPSKAAKNSLFNINQFRDMCYTTTTFARHHCKVQTQWNNRECTN